MFADSLRARLTVLMLAAAISIAASDCGGSGSSAADGAIDRAQETAQDGVGTDAPADDVAKDAGKESAVDSASEGPSGDAPSSDAPASDAPPSDTPAGEGGPSEVCTKTGGTVAKLMCCTSTGDFPDTCLSGPCGCAPAYSHDVTACICPMSQCYTPGMGCHPR